MFAHYVGVDEEVSVTHTEMFLTGSTFETFQVIYFVFHSHGHFIGADPLVTGGAETILAKKPEGKKERKAKKTQAEATLEEKVSEVGGNSKMSGSKEELGPDRKTR